MLVSLGEDPVIKRAKFSVTADIYSVQDDDYIHEWFGGEFSSYDKAFEYWDIWNPPEDQVLDILSMQMPGDYELEIYIWSSEIDEPSELAFLSRALEVSNV